MLNQDNHNYGDYMKINLSFKNLVKFNIYYSILVMGLMSYFNLPNYITYLSDIINISVLILYFAKNNKVNNSVIDAMKMPSVFFLLTVVSLFINHEPFMLYLWGLRNYFRFYILFLEIVMFFDIDDFSKFFDSILKLNILNFILIMQQYLIMGLRQDRLGGIFGFASGCNIGLNVFMVITIIIALSRFDSGRMKFSFLSLIIVANLFIAVLSELKFFFVEFMVVCLIYLLLTKLSFKKALFTILGIALLVIAVSQLYIIYPQWESFFTLDKIIESSESYSTQNDVGRLSAFRIIKEIFFEGKTISIKSLFGLGLGSAEFSNNFSIMNSDIYLRYRFLNYMWFSSAFLLIELGYLGVIIYIGTFASSINRSRKILKDVMYRDLGLIALTMGIISILLFIYNVSLRVYSGYMIYTLLAIPYVYQKNTLKKINEEK